MCPGDGNLGLRGMALFFRTHECNQLCSRIKLEPFERCATDVAAQVGDKLAGFSNVPCAKPSTLVQTKFGLRVHPLGVDGGLCGRHCHLFSHA